LQRMQTMKGKWAYLVLETSKTVATLVLVSVIFVCLCSFLLLVSVFLLWPLFSQVLSSSPVRSSPFCLWFFRDEGTKTMVMPILFGGLWFWVVLLFLPFVLFSCFLPFLFVLGSFVVPVFFRLCLSLCVFF